MLQGKSVQELSGGGVAKLFCYSLLSLSISNSFAEETTLGTINVIDSPESIQNKKVGETIKTSKTLEKQQISNTRDLVKYETGISVVEKGRMGSSGYAVRGVEENRVNITIDGLQQAQTLSSQGFKELFEGYGNFNNTRNGIEVETIKEVNLAKGSDSTKVGSGALGGSVIFKTKDARDFLIGKDFYYKFKAGYASANNEDMFSHTLAGRYKYFDALLVRTDRDGTNFENFGYDKYDDNAQGRSRQKADPYTIEKASTLVKLGYNPNENNRFTVMLDNSLQTSRGTDWSYTLAPLKSEPDKPETASRHTNDKSKRKNIAFSYENYSETPFWDSLKFTFSQQEITQTAQTDEWCEGGEKCQQYANPAGLKLEKNGAGTVVDQYGGRVKTSRENNLTVLTDSKGKKFHTYSPKRANETWFDCSYIDCSKEIDVFKLGWGDGDATYSKAKLDKIYVDDDGKKWASTNSWDFIDYPATSGFSEGFYRKRDLITKTKDIRLDLTKLFTIYDIDNDLKYGVSYTDTKKSMVNTEYFRVVPNTPIMWWAERFPGLDFWTGKKKECKDVTNTLICPKEGKLFSFLLPVKTKTESLYFANNMQVNDWLAFDLGYRYDRISYKPEYIEGETPAIPDEMVKGVFIPLPSKPNWRDYPTWGDYTKARDKYEKLAKENPALNRKYLTEQKRKMDHHSYSFGATIDPTDYLRIQAKYSNGFRAPTSDEMYFTFKHPDFTIKPNNDLKPETAKTKELAFTLHQDNSFITFSGFRTDYRNFIDLNFLGTETFTTDTGSRAGLPYLVYQNINQEKAKVKGFAINTKLFLSQFSEKLTGFNVGYKYSYQKGKMYRKNEQSYVPINAIQPHKQVFSLGYIAPEGKYGLDFYWTHASSKKASDTYNQFHKEEQANDSYAKYLSRSFDVFDMVGFYKPIKHLTLQAGIYNLFNKDYMTWENARSIRSIGTSNRICQRGNVKSLGCNYPDQGIERFHSPERNFKFNLQYEF
ncbi:TonB-dependent hemoglobin/transferrin/lactoferrin family receptor [Phocoenobacter skyensis]|uniref:Hemoglobin/transferrin/lactoferrin receptor protein n=1 Tax=Phocoenobacter skyensis TaxID=97481 RepID=A0A1H7XD33_9PAST|nr:TonB-dependent hemoglobin/transferrin/lactoferrin family receptor [Pasteurella skyensis]MDP8079662.1 TonB-dependent hemoglobin/transferrin/lactoferrin family receptor [Pasteurella skyensis]MDP8085638.1 TonB-dependent hemoglobin/transferrin/lactoferrin family receptor [Pasteurella skyensis]MDP8174588.1 TonB-dependent hemoglobin/transferrin/lactoferrin family receptor [Pasteurella skyensis]MDP8185379.1 TonB-dependent hemoglobin/transferrin/lactoferrin family receptor [Pasteurella skyensis]QLB